MASAVVLEHLLVQVGCNVVVATLHQSVATLSVRSPNGMLVKH